MSVNDPVADMLTRIRNAKIRNLESVDMPSSSMKKAIAKVLKESGYISDFKFVSDKKSGLLKIYLKYSPDGESMITEIVRVSKPGRRIYAGVSELPKVLDGLGLSIISTPKGIMGDKECRKLNLGGEVLCKVW
ncbi:MAG: 30S ribosomal protein S8 [Candidatus Brocadiia bacterium]